MCVRAHAYYMYIDDFCTALGYSYITLNQMSSALIRVVGYLLHDQAVFPGPNLRTDSILNTYTSYVCMHSKKHYTDIIILYIYSLPLSKNIHTHARTPM